MDESHHRNRPACPNLRAGWSPFSHEAFPSVAVAANPDTVARLASQRTFLAVVDEYNDGDMPGNDPLPDARAGGQFPATRWSVILAATGRPDVSAGRALDELCRAYWPPIYNFVRRSGRNPEEAQDLTQAFFERVIENNYVQQADRERGRFRSFLLGTLKHFLADEWDRSRALKRGGGCAWVSLDDPEAEARYQLESSHDLTPDRSYDRRWAMALMERAMARMEDEYATWGRREVCRGLLPLLSGGRDAGFAQVASRLGLTEGAAKMTVQRMRRRFRELLRDEVRQTVASDAEIGEELRFLLELVGE